MRVVLLALVALGSLSASAFAQEEPDYVAELRKQNEQLQERVRRLEAASMEEAIEAYLEQADSRAQTEGANSILPGGLALRISGEIRIRGEVRDHVYADKDADAANSFAFTHMRTRVRLDVDVTNEIAAVVEFQDVRNFGEELSTVGMLDGVDIKRAYMLFKEIGGKALELELGRFVMHYGDQRVIGHLEWVDQGRSYDGFRLLHHPEGWWIDLFGVNVRETLATEEDLYFVGVYGGKGVFEAYLLWLSDQMPGTGEAGTGKTNFLTIGARAHGKQGAWDWTGEITYQGAGEVNGDDLSALGAALIAGYSFKEAKWKPRVGIEVAYASGDSDPTDGDNEQLQTLFPTNHLWYGYIDVVGWSNIIDFRLRLTARPAEKWFVSLDYHHFRRPEELGDWINAAGDKIRDGAAGADNHLGDEIDLVIKWTPLKAFSLVFGYSIFIPGGFVDDTGEDPVSQFFYLQARLLF
jgi:hypothetical protein